MRNKIIFWFPEISRRDISLVGGKGANLGELSRANFPVPEGFCLSTKAYFDFIRQYKIDEIIEEELTALNYEDSELLHKASAVIKEAILDAPLPKKIEEEIIKAYEKIDNSFVAVRSSASAEDLPEASFAGQQATFLNVKGKDKLLEAVKKSWASLFEARAIYYRFVNNFDHLKVGLSVVVQRMIQSEVSGVMFTVDPLTNRKDLIYIEAAYGLGEVVVSGAVRPDRYWVKKRSFTISKKDISRQNWMLKKQGLGDRRVPVACSLQNQQKLANELIIQLARLGKKIEKHYGVPQDIEWAMEKEKLYIVQARPVTTLERGKKQKEVKAKHILLKGQGASSGQVSGKVVIISSPKELNKVKKGDILVAKMTNPSYVPAMRKAAGIITDEGGATSHAAIVSRELGIACVVGTEKATKVLKNNELVTVDGERGLVYAGDAVINKEVSVISHKKLPKTKTKIYVNLGEVAAAKKVAKLSVDGVGLLRAEFMIAEIGVHPRYMWEKGESGKFVKRLTEGIRVFAQAFNPRPVIYRATDFKTNEYRNLKGGEKYEKTESNPMLGYRGAMRYIQEPDLFGLELEALKRVRRRYKNVWLMIPFVRTVDEMKKVLFLLKKAGLKRSQSFKVLAMCEVPSTVILADKFMETGIDGFSIGSNDLTQLLLGLDRDNERLSFEFDERDPAVIWAIRRIIRLTHRKKGLVSICGQAPSRYPEYVRFLVKEKIDSISVNPDAVEKTKKMVAEIEKELKISK
ncbi:phosphoenolpyruvate synthase [bacterium]|nr:phosphoenolpyruvate synthase [bacterium]